MDATRLDFRDSIFDGVGRVMDSDPTAVVLYNDMGAVGLDKIKARHPDRVVNAGIAEQNMVSVAAGLSMTGRTVFVYGIASHVTSRCYEQFKLDVCASQLPVVLLGIGSGLSYGTDGPTHHATEDIGYMRAIPGLDVYNPSDGVSAAALVDLAYRQQRPAYIRFDKEQHPPLYERAHSFTDGLATLEEGNDVTIISTGLLVHDTLRVAEILTVQGIECRVVDLYRVSPLNATSLSSIMESSKMVVVAEENSASGGIGESLASLAIQMPKPPRFKRIALPDEFRLGSAARGWIHQQSRLTAEQMAADIAAAL